MKQLFLETASLVSVVAFTLLSALFLTRLAKLFSLATYGYRTALTILIVSGAVAAAVKLTLDLAQHNDTVSTFGALLSSGAVFLYGIKRYLQSTLTQGVAILFLVALFQIVVGPPIGRLTYLALNPILVRNEGMLPAIRPGEYVVVVPVDKSERGDIIAFTTRSGEQCLARIVALPGERVEIKDGYVLVNAIRLDEPYSRGTTSGNLSLFLEDGQYFVLGDNRSVRTCDSRTEGTISHTLLSGKVIYKTSSLYRQGHLVDL